MAFITTKEQLHQYVTIEGGIEFEKLKPYLIRAERDLQEIIGKELSLKIQFIDKNETLKEANDYACGLIASKALSEALNALKLKISNSGVKLSTPQNTDQPNWWDVKDLQRDLNKTSNKYLNYLLKCFDQNTDLFPEWVTSPVQAPGKDLLIKSLDDFENYYSLNGSFTTFIALRPFIRDAQFIHVEKQLNGCYNSDDLTDEMLQDIKGALANYTIAAVADTGLFKLEENGALVKLELMPWEKAEKITDFRLDRLKEQRLEIAKQYLKKTLMEISKLLCFIREEETELLTIKKPSMLFVGRHRI